MQLLKLRYFQWKRDLGYWVLIISAVVFFIVKEISVISPKHSLFLTAALIVILYAYHANRKDLIFISHYLHKPLQQVVVIYNLLLLPVSTALLINQQWPFAIALHGAASLMVFTRFKTTTPKLIFIGKYIPHEQFEWTAGIRANLYILLPLLLIAIILSPVKLFGLAALLLLNSIVTGFYNSFEPLIMLNPNNLDAAEFLKRKTTFTSKIMLIINTPLLTVNALFHPEIAWFNGCFLLAFLLLASCAVYIKYAHYRPNEQLGIHIDYLVLFATLFIPYLLPLGIFIYFSNRKKAIQHLYNYTDDHSKNNSV